MRELPNANISVTKKAGYHKQYCHFCDKRLYKGDDLVVYSYSMHGWMKDARFCSWNCLHQCFQHTLSESHKRCVCEIL